MSGTSLDGLDMAFCRLWKENEKYGFKIVQATTISYHHEMFNKLSMAHRLNGRDLIALHTEYGAWLGKQVHQFMDETHLIPDFVASHGHTVFHRPDSGYTFQIGLGSAIAANCGVPTVCDFRTGDVALGGQGAPLVPVGDRLLFADYDFCLNLGGFANISLNKKNEQQAFDICPVNIVLNHLAAFEGLPYDKDGKSGMKGSLIPDLLESLNGLNYYKQSGPGSLGREWVEEEVFPLFNSNEYRTHDLLRTVYEHVACQIQKTLASEKGKILVTGGGAKNKFLIQLLRDRLNAEIVIPDVQIVDYKEALIFALLAYLYIGNEKNCIKTVTGANRDSIGGCLYKPLTV